MYSVFSDQAGSLGLFQAPEFDGCVSVPFAVVCSLVAFPGWKPLLTAELSGGQVLSSFLLLQQLEGKSVKTHCRKFPEDTWDSLDQTNQIRCLGEDQLGAHPGCLCFSSIIFIICYFHF